MPDLRLRALSQKVACGAALFAAGLGLHVGCSDGGDRLPASPGLDIVGPGRSDASTSCKDGDGDGFGSGCTAGTDCDDSDPEVTDACYRCLTPNDDCPCDTEGQVVDCGEVSSQVGNRVTCIVGERTCNGGVWSGCRPKSMRTMSLPRTDYRLLAVGTSPTACDGNPCDPLCKHYPSTTTPDTDGNTTIGMDGVTLTPKTADGGIVTSDAGTACASTPQQASRDPLGMMMAVDTSGSIAGTPWTNLSGAMKTFFQDSGLEGLTAGLDFFPGGLGDPDYCDVAQYEDPNLAASGILGADAPSFVSAIDAQSPNGSTPMLPAVQGALESVSGWAGADPTRKGVVVLVTDGQPTVCGNCEGKSSKKSAKQMAACRVQEIGTLIENYYFDDPSIETFVIGVDTGDNLDFLNNLARAGSGGSRDATIIDGTSSDAESQLVDALNSIRDESLSCEFDVPAPSNGVIDPDTTTVTLSSGGVDTEISKVTSVGACTGDGFIYETTGPKILLCPDTCSAAKSDLSASIEIVYGCKDACTSGSNQGEPGPLDMFVMMDRSGSMGDEVSGVTKWQAASLALRNFVRSEDSEGLGFGISYFAPPDGCQTCGVCGGLWCSSWQGPTPYPFCSDPKSSGDYGDCVGADGSYGSFEYYANENSTCDPADFVNVSLTQGVDYGILPGTGDTQVDAVMESLAKIMPDGGTPTEPALEGAIDHAIAQGSANPDRKQVVVLVTDGQPNNCSSDVAGLTTLAQNGFDQGVETYVIGVPDPSNQSALDNLDQVALAGTGNETGAFILTTDDGDPNFNPVGQFIDAMNTIRQKSMNCSFDVPTPPADGTLDIESPQILLSASPDPAGGAATQEYDLTRVADSGSCGSDTAWYYDDPSSPATINLCDASCALAQDDVDSRLDILYQCLAPAVEYNDGGDAVFEYDASSACADDQHPVWADWSWIAETPSDSRIEFYVQTGQRDTMGTISNLSDEVQLQFTSDTLDGDPLCVSQPNVCDPGVSEDTQEGGQLVVSPGDAYVDKTLERQELFRNLNYLKIRARLVPSTDLTQAPVLTDWDLQVTCEDNE